MNKKVWKIWLARIWLGSALALVLFVLPLEFKLVIGSIVGSSIFVMITLWALENAFKDKDN